MPAAVRLKTLPIKTMTSGTKSTSEKNVDKIPIRQYGVARFDRVLAGLSGGVLATAILHPLDIIKTRMAVCDQRTLHYADYTGLRSAIAKIYHEEGARGFYRAVLQNATTAGVSWGTYFLIYNGIKSRKQTDPEKPLGMYEHLKIALMAGATNLMICNPLIVVKTRLILQTRDDARTQNCYKGLIDGVRKLYKTEGIKGFYKGVTPGLVGITHGALQMVGYEEMKEEYCIFMDIPINTKLPIHVCLMSALSSKILASCITYPPTVVRNRLIDQRTNFSGVIDCLVKTWRSDSIRGFYRGFIPHLLHVVPNTCIVMLVYERFASDPDPA